MPQYEAGALIFTDRSELVEPGQKFASDAVPGKNWKPLDDAAKEAFAKRFPPVEPTVVSIKRQPSPETVEIPADWRDRVPILIYKLASQLFGDYDVPEGMTKFDRACELIDAEVAKRAAAQPVMN